MPRETRSPRSLSADDMSACQCGSIHKPGKDGACFDCRVEDWTEQQILTSKHFGPGVIGKAQYEYVQGFISTTNEGRFGPALLGKYVESQVRVPPGKVGV